MNETDIKTLGTGERKHFKKDAQTSGRQEIWRMRNIKGLRELYENADIVADI